MEKITYIKTDIAEVNIEDGVLYLKFLVENLELIPLKKHNQEVDTAF
jgi:hypothetical protein